MGFIIYKANHNCLKMKQFGFTIQCLVMRPKLADGMANSVDPNQTAPLEAV